MSKPNSGWILAAALLIGGCSESGGGKGHAGAQSAAALRAGDPITEPAGAEAPVDRGEKPYDPPRRYESSVLNQANDSRKATSPRVNGSGYGPKSVDEPARSE